MKLHKMSISPFPTMLSMQRKSFRKTFYARKKLYENIVEKGEIFFEFEMVSKWCIREWVNTMKKKASGKYCGKR